MLYIFGHINKPAIRKNLNRAIEYQNSLKALPLKTTNPHAYTIKIDEQEGTVAISGNRNDIITGCRFLFNAYRKLKLTPEYFTFKEDFTPNYSQPIPWYDTEESFIFKTQSTFSDCVKYFSNKANVNRIGIYRALKVHNFKPYTSVIEKYIDTGYLATDLMLFEHNPILKNELNTIIELFKSDIDVMIVKEEMLT